MFLARYESQVYAVYRIVFGFLFLFHGTQKILNLPPSSMAGEMPAFIKWGAGPWELIGGLLIMVGFRAGWAGFLCSGLMAGAYWIAHGLKAPLPIQNGGELAVLYCFGFLLIAAKGSGTWSLDAKLGS